MQATVNPSPFPPETGYTIHVTGGVPPYKFVPAPAPPNPQGVQVEPPASDGDADVVVPPPQPPKTEVMVLVTDSSIPSHTILVTNTTR